MKRTLVVVAAVVGFAAAASASTLTVFTTNSSNVAQTVFNVGDTILLKVTGVATGTDLGIQGRLDFNAAITSVVGTVQGTWLPTIVNNSGDGFSYAFNQTSGSAQAAINPTDTTVITLIADAIGTSTVTWGGSSLDFFGIYQYPITDPSTGASFSIIPEPTTATLIGLGLFGLALGGRRRA